MTFSPSARSKVFISYSHKDAEWLQLLRTHLKPVERMHGIEIWDDRKIEPGMVWKDEIGRALAGAKVAVLLVSADFLNSEFIDREELPPLLEAAHREGVRILPVLVRPSMFADIEALQRYQAVNPPEQALSKLAEADRDEQLVNIARAIAQAMREPGAAAQAAAAEDEAQAPADEDEQGLALPEALFQALDEMLADPDVQGLAFRAAAADEAAELMILAEGANGHVLCELLANDELPKALRLTRQAQRYLVDEQGFNAPEARGDRYWIDLGPGEELDLEQLTAFLLDIFEQLWGLPSDEVWIDWEPLGR